MIPQSIGKRIADLRHQHGWTQEYLAERVGVSRVAVSHIELDLSVPSERTVSLLAGLFKIPPHELVAETTYPQAKADRLPAAVCSYTELEVDLILLERDVWWLERISKPTGNQRLQQEFDEKWRARLAYWDNQTVDEKQQETLSLAWKKITGVRLNT
ncbi:MAG: helix-turn-helix transcriptional regulator [Chloroflexi bacterium]|nr:helix-turn-helix transcriptional regulator [Chloroflexota bacterium]